MPLATRMRYANAEGLTENINDSGQAVLKAKLVTGEKLLRLSKLAIEKRSELEEANK